jgi:hypothetical protein
MSTLNPNFGATPPLIQEDEFARVPPVWKVPVRAATTGAVTLSGLQTVDGVVLLERDLILVKNQASAIDNGIYLVAATAWTRAQDLIALTSATGVTVYVGEGTVNADKVFICTNPAASGITSVNNLVFALLASPNGGPAAGTNGQVQYNNNGALAGDSITVNGSGTMTNATIIDNSNNVAANSLKTTGAVVTVSGSAPPATNSVLIATSATTATWQPQSALTGASATLQFAEYLQYVQGTNSSVAASQGNSFLVDTPVYTTSAIVKSNNSTIGTVWTLAAGTYVIDYGMNLSSTGPVGLYTGTAVGSLAFDQNTMTGSTVSTTWVNGRSILTVASGTVVALGASVSTGVVAVSGTGAPNYTVRVTFLKIA